MSELPSPSCILTSHVHILTVHILTSNNKTNSNRVQSITISTFHLSRIPRSLRSALTNMTATLETASAPGTRLGSPAPSTHRFSTPPPPPSSAVPTDFRSSLSAWWNNTSYKEARLAEERLLRRMAHFRPPPPPVEKGWFGRKPESSQGNEVQEVVEPLGTEHGLVATLRNVFIPTPDPSLAPAHPADPAGSSPAPSSAPSIASTDSKRKQKEKALVDYINTLEISKSGDDSKQAVVVLHGYAAALGYVWSLKA